MDTKIKSETRQWCFMNIWTLYPEKKDPVDPDSTFRFAIERGGNKTKEVRRSIFLLREFHLIMNYFGVNSLRELIGESFGTLEDPIIFLTRITEAFKEKLKA